MSLNSPTDIPSELVHPSSITSIGTADIDASSGLLAKFPGSGAVIVADQCHHRVPSLNKRSAHLLYLIVLLLPNSDGLGCHVYDFMYPCLFTAWFVRIYRER
jgi:hypothetical protein